MKVFDWVELNRDTQMNYPVVKNDMVYEFHYVEGNLVACGTNQSMEWHIGLGTDIGILLPVKDYTSIRANCCNQICKSTEPDRNLIPFNLSGD